MKSRTSLDERLERLASQYRTQFGTGEYNAAQARLALALAERFMPTSEFTIEAKAINPTPEHAGAFLNALWAEVKRLENGAGQNRDSFILRGLTSVYHAHKNFFRDGDEMQFVDWTVHGCESLLDMDEQAIEASFASAFAPQTN